MAASALSLVPVKGIFTVHIILKIVNRLFRGQLQKICSVIQRWSVFWRTFLRFAPVQLSPFRSVRCDFLMKAMPAVRRVRLKGLEANAQYVCEQTGLEVSGDTLMNAGVNLPDTRQDFDSVRWVFTRI